MSTQEILLLAIQISVFLTVMSFGLQTSLGDILYLLRRPAYLFRAMVSMFVIMPIVVVLLVSFVNIEFVIQIALVSIAVSPVPSILPDKALKQSEHKSLTYGLLAVAALLSPFLVPFAFRLFGAVFHHESHFPELAVIRVISVTVLMPIVVGMLIRRLAPSFSERTAASLGQIGIFLLIAPFLPMMVGFLPVMWSLIGNGSIVVIVAFSIISLMVGHWLGGPEPGDRTLTAIETSTRHPAFAIALTGAIIGTSDVDLAISAVILYAISSAVVAATYLAWLTGSEKAIKQRRLAQQNIRSFEG